MDSKAKREQVADQCKVVAHIARAIQEVHIDMERLMRDDESAESADRIADIVGERTASLMNGLGDVLNGMDAVSEDDNWCGPVFDRQRKMFPVK